LTITAPSDVIKCGACQPFTATYTKGGTPQTVTPTWSTDNPAVATIDPSGQLTAVSNGDVTVTARYEGVSAIKSVHIVNDYGTLWAGNYVITRCEETQDFKDAGFCDEDVFEPGQTAEVALDFQQERYAVTGTMWLGALNGSFTGTVATAGELTGESKMTMTFEGGVMDILVAPFRVVRQGDRIPEGSFTVTMTIPGAHGHGVYDARVMGLDKVPSGRAVARQTPRMPHRPHDVFRLVRR